ncbi:MAG: hypothetical protein RIE52_11680 [Balneola sp.]|jgi:hypothetical protein
MKKFTGLLALFFIGTSFLYSQSTSPTLQAGLSGIAFDKGDLDAEVIAKLIAEKQDEIKVRLIQTMLLDDLDEAGGLISAYVNDLLNVVLSGSKPQVQTKNILESTVNVAVVLAFVNHYVGVIDGNERANLNKFAMSLGYVLPRNYKDIPPPSSLVDMIKNPIYSEASYKISKSDTKVEASKLENKVLTQLAAYLIDLAAESLQNNEVLKERGLFRFIDSDWYNSESLYRNLEPRSSDFSERRFFESYIMIGRKVDTLDTLKDRILNTESQIRSFLELQEQKRQIRLKKVAENDLDAISKFDTELNNLELKINKLDSTIQSDENHVARLTDYIKTNLLDNDSNIKKGVNVYARQVYQDIQKYVNAYVDAFGVFDFIYRNGLQVSSIDTLFSAQLDSLAKSITGLNLKWNIDINNIDLAKYQELVSHLKKSLENIPKEKRGEFEEFFTEVEQLLIKSKIETGKTLKQYEQIHLIGNKLLPVARKIVTLSGDTSSVELVLRKAELQLVADAVDSLSAKLGLTKKVNDSFVAFYELFGSIQNLDDIQSFEQFIKSFYLSLDIFVDGKLKSTLQRVVGLTTDHIELVKTDSADYVNVDVQGVLASLSEMKYNRWRPLSLYLTVGGNFMWFPDEDQQVQEKAISSFQYFGEKIGLKIKIRDNAYLNSFSKGETFSYHGKKYIRKAPPKKPVVNDYHFLLYASGLLYNLTGTSSESSLNSTMVGAGFGLSFFNGLDFNVSAGMPVGISNPEFFLNVGFDIRFMEYIQALGK